MGIKGAGGRGWLTFTGKRHLSLLTVKLLCWSAESWASTKDTHLFFLWTHSERSVHFLRISLPIFPLYFFQILSCPVKNVSDYPWVRENLYLSSCLFQAILQPGALLRALPTGKIFLHHCPSGSPLSSILMLQLLLFIFVIFQSRARKIWYTSLSKSCRLDYWLLGSIQFVIHFFYFS